MGIYTTNSPDACQYVLENCKANIVVVENNKQLQKILQVEDKLPHLKAIIQYKDALKEKRANLYSVREHGVEGKDEIGSPSNRPDRFSLCSPVGRVHGARAG